MELDEFHILQHGAGAVGNGHAVAGGYGRIGGFGIHLAQATGGEQYGLSVNLLHTPGLFVEQPRAAYAAIFDQQIDAERERQEFDARARAREEYAQNFAPG
jgi:hypothetical protein